MTAGELPNLGVVRILDRVGGGALGDSFLAQRPETPPSDPPDLVVKVLHRHLLDNQEARSLLEHEARLLSVVDHPGIPGLRGTGVVDGRPYLAMTWVPGDDLAAWLGRRGEDDDVKDRLPLAAATDLGVQLADILQHVHERRDPDGAALMIVHRDLAPDNVRIDGEGIVHLLDFGVAWSRWLPPGCREGVRGTPRYMAPEQIRGENPDRRADVYALGVILFEALSGRRLRTGTLPGLLVDAADRKAPPLHGLDPSVPPELCAVVDAALVLDPRDRTATAAEVGASLRQAATFLGLPAPGGGDGLAKLVG